MQKAFAAALSGGALPEGLVGPDLDRRFAVYRNNVATSLSQALATRFPVVRALVGEAFFAPLARAYADHDGPQSPVLAEWGAGFAGFLDAFPPLVAWPYLGDVARIEFARGEAFHAADAPPLDPARLAGRDPMRLRLVFHPSVRVLALAHPAVSIWARHQPGGDPLPALGPQTALILRDRAFGVPVRALTEPQARLVTGLLAGQTLAEAATEDPTPLLAALLHQGALTDLED